MKRVLLALVGTVAVVAGALGASRLYQDSGMSTIAREFIRGYTERPGFDHMSHLLTADFVTAGVADYALRQQQAARRHLGPFEAVEDVHIDRSYRRGRFTYGEFQFLGRFKKGTAIVKLAMLETPQAWMVISAEIEMSPSVLNRSPAEFAEMYVLRLLRKWAAGDFETVRSMCTETYRTKLPKGTLEAISKPLLAARDKLRHVGVVLSEPAGTNRRDLRALAEFETGTPVGFDVYLTWRNSRWRVDDLRIEEAFGETIPPERRRSAEQRPGR